MNTHKIWAALWIIVVILLGIGGFFAWQKGWLPGGGSDTVVLREDLPLAPAGYNTLNEDPAVAGEISEANKQRERKNFEEFVRTIEEHPDSFGAWFNLGSVKNYFGDYKGAEDAWLYATEISPNQARSLMNLGDLYWNKLNNYERAEWAYLTAIERDDPSANPTQLYRDLASLYRFSYTEKHDQAFEILQLGIDNLDDTAELLALAGMWAWEDGRFAEAEAYYEQFLQQNPEHTEAQKDLERIRRREPLPR